MLSTLPIRSRIIIAAVLIAVGAERLLSAYWMGRTWMLSSTRFVVAALCLTLGASLLAFVAVERTRRRRRPRPF